jgi:hypothetical protein
MMARCEHTGINLNGVHYYWLMSDPVCFDDGQIVPIDGEHVVGQARHVDKAEAVPVVHVSECSTKGRQIKIYRLPG